MTDAVPSGDVPLSILAHKIFKTHDEWDKREHEQKLMQELQVHVCVCAISACVYLHDIMKGFHSSTTYMLDCTHLS